MNNIYAPRAFFFDMDGVLANTESEWDSLGYDEMIINFFGANLASKVEIGSGLSIKGIFDKFACLGWQGPFEDFQKANDLIGDQIYSNVELTPGVDSLLTYLKKENFKIGIVSSSPMKWVKELAERFANHELIDLKISVNNDPHLKPKPSPDPYLHAMDKLKVAPSETYILEDSVTGVTSGKASGAQVICFTRYYNPENKWQSIADNADYYAKSMEEVRALLGKLMFP